MSKIRKEALGNLDEFEDFQSWPSYEAEVQARRVLLLEKAYRYQRAAYKLLTMCRDMRECCPYLFTFEGCLVVCSKADFYHKKSADLYRQAEEL